MKARANKIRCQFTETGQQEIVLSLIEKSEIADLKKSIENDKLLVVEVKQYHQHRSLNSNAFLWVMLEKMAGVLNATKDELYLQMLDRYGVFTHLIVKQQAVNRVIGEWRTVRNLGEIKINGQTGVQLQCYFGSSGYDTAEMARLIDGVVSECADLGIETLPQSEIDAMNQQWGR